MEIRVMRAQRAAAMMRVRLERTMVPPSSSTQRFVVPFEAVGVGVVDAEEGNEVEDCDIAAH